MRYFLKVSIVQRAGGRTIPLAILAWCICRGLNSIVPSMTGLLREKTQPTIMLTVQPRDKLARRTKYSPRDTNPSVAKVHGLLHTHTDLKSTWQEMKKPKKTTIFFPHCTYKMNRTSRLWEISEICQLAI